MKTPQPLLTPDEVWFRAPIVQTRHFYPVFSRVARALHTALREEVPALYFRDPARYGELRWAYPILLFAASQPSRSFPQSEFSYDVLKPERMDTFFRLAEKRMPVVVAAARSAVLAAGLTDLVPLYEPDQAAAIKRRCRLHQTYRQGLNQMLVMEGRLLSQLSQIPSIGASTLRQRARRVADFNYKWGVSLRRFCGQFDFTEAAPRLLSAATDALVEVLDEIELPPQQNRRAA